MKKILSTAMAIMMLASTITTAVAAGDSTDYTNGTQITLVGSQQQASYTVTVPSTLSPGQSGAVSASGQWDSGSILTVGCPNKVTLTCGEQTIDVGIDFPGIAAVGDDINAISASANVAVENATALFGTWTGVLEYSVELRPNTSLNQVLEGV